MNELVEGYVKYLSEIRAINKPKMPRYDVSAYTENEYILAINGVMEDYSKVDDLAVTEKFIKGE